MRSTPVLTPLALAAGLLLAAAPAQAQVICSVPTAAGGSCTVNQDLSTNVLYSATVATASTVTLLDWSPGAVSQATTQVSVQSNAPWSLSVQGASATWTGGDGTKPVGDLEWDAVLDGGGTFGNTIPMTESPAYIAANQAATTATPVTYNVVYVGQFSFADPPGAYSISVIYTLTAP